MKEFQALGLDISIIDDNGETLQLKEIEEAEDHEDTKLNIDEVEKTPAVALSSSEEDDNEELKEEFEDEI